MRDLISDRTWQLVHVFRRLLVALIFLEATNQFRTRIFLILFLVAAARQQHARLDLRSDVAARPCLPPPSCSAHIPGGDESVPHADLPHPVPRCCCAATTCAT